LGGEEFVMVLPGADAANAASIAERARLAIEQEDFAVASASRPLAITASIGLAECGDVADWRELYRRADKALYRAKTEGRNRVNAAA